MRLRDRKGRTILCLRLSSKWGLVGRCTRSAFRRTPSHKNSFTPFIHKKALRFKNGKAGTYRTATSAYRTGRALQDAELQDGDKRLQDGQSPTGLLVN